MNAGIPPNPHSPDDIELLRTLCAEVRTNLASYRDAGSYLDEAYSITAFRKSVAEKLRALKANLSDRRNAIHFRKVKASQWRRKKGLLPRLGVQRLQLALESEQARLSVHMTLLQAQSILLLAWLLEDRQAHLVEPSVCTFQELPWDPAAVVSGEDFQGRGSLAHLMNARTLGWCRRALAIAAPAQPGHASASTSLRATAARRSLKKGWMLARDASAKYQIPSSTMHV